MPPTKPPELPQQPHNHPLTLQMRPTDEVVTLDGVQCRVWHGRLLTGAGCYVYVHRIACADSEACDMLELHLSEQDAPPSHNPKDLTFFD